MPIIDVYAKPTKRRVISIDFGILEVGRKSKHDEIVSPPPSLACKRIERCSPSCVDYFYGRSTCVHRQPTGLTCNSSMYHLPVKSRVWQINTNRN